MADKNITIEEPNATDRMPRVEIDNGLVRLTYVRNGNVYVADVKISDFPPPLKADYVKVLSGIVAYSKTLFKRSDGKDNSGF